MNAFKFDNAIPVPTDKPRTRSGEVSDALRALAEHAEFGQSLVIYRPVGQVRAAIARMIEKNFLPTGTNLEARDIGKSENDLPMTRVWKLAK